MVRVTGATPWRGSSIQAIAAKTSADFVTWSATTPVTTPAGYWDYWPEPTALNGLTLLYTSEAGSPAGTGHIYQLTTPVGPTNKDECKNDGWKSFTNPSFKNQGDCVSSVQAAKK